MGSDNSTIEDHNRRRLYWPQRRRWRALLVILPVILAIVVWGWISREQIATNVIEGQLTEFGLQADYEIVSVGPAQQIVRDIVVGDPRAPDLMIDRMVVDLGYGLHAPTIDRVEVSGARLFGSYRDGQLSFGALDAILFDASDGPVGLPALNVDVIDARARIDSDFGVIGIKADGAGLLDSGFAGILAATAPGLAMGDCGAETVTLFGSVQTDSGTSRFSGPLRIDGFACPEQELAIRRVQSEVAAELAPDFTVMDMRLGLAAYVANYAELDIGGVKGTARIGWNGEQINLRHDLTASNVSSPFGSMSTLKVDGGARAEADLVRAEWEGRITGDNLAVDRSAIPLDAARDAAKGTLLSPLLAKFERNFSSQSEGGSVAADISARRDEYTMSVAVPEARLRSGNGETLLALSRLSWNVDEDGIARLSTNLATGGVGLPRINGRMERVGRGDLGLRLKMDRYAQGADQLSIPEMAISQSASGTVRFAGLVEANGAVPNGAVQGLRVPLSGIWNRTGALELWRECATVAFDSLTISEVELDAEELEICPQADRAIMTYTDQLEIAANVEAIDLQAKIAGTPASISADAIAMNFPERSTVEGLAVRFGEAGEGADLTAEMLWADFAGSVSGGFSGGTASIDAVPLDMSKASGSWAFADQILKVTQSDLRVADRAKTPRFYTLKAYDAELTLDGSEITANAVLKHPDFQPDVAKVRLDHNLASGTGSADIIVDDLTFGEGLQPDNLTVLTEGVIALAEGSVAGSGRIGWSPDTLSSTGTFSTENFDFAAAFGPVKGAKGTISFNDLLGMTSAPSQTLFIESIDSGVEVLAGEITYSIINGEIIKLEEARWPFMGGSLELRPLEMNFSRPETRRYVFEVVGLDAATFVSQMEFGNLAATGKFDGTVPIEFDEMGNGNIDGGLLISREQGGNVSYVGELAYEDAGAIANFAFDALRSLNYRQMAITMDGDLTGEIITSVRFDGISQGEGASQNLVTKQIAKLPIRFNVNVRSQFWQLSVLLRSMYDANYLRNPCDVTSGVQRMSSFYSSICPDTLLPDAADDSSLPANDDLLPSQINGSEPTIQPEESEPTP